MGRSRTRTGKAIADHTPLVAHTERAAFMLGIDADALAAAVAAAQLEPWGEHHDGMPVYAWGRLLEVAANAGLPIPQRKGHAWRRRPAVGRRVGPDGTEQ